MGPVEPLATAAGVGVTVVDSISDAGGVTVDVGSSVVPGLAVASGVTQGSIVASARAALGASLAHETTVGEPSGVRPTIRVTVGLGAGVRSDAVSDRHAL